MKTDQWYFLEISWSSSGGLQIYVDLQKVADSDAAKESADEMTVTESRLCIGCFNAATNASNAVQRVAANIILDEMQICYGSCAKLTQFEFLQRGTTDLYKSDDFNLFV